jgi:hypothetical protein
MMDGFATISRGTYGTSRQAKEEEAKPSQEGLE